MTLFYSVIYYFSMALTFIPLGMVLYALVITYLDGIPKHED